MVWLVLEKGVPELLNELKMEAMVCIWVVEKNRETKCFSVLYNSGTNNLEKIFKD